MLLKPSHGPSGRLNAEAYVACSESNAQHGQAELVGERIDPRPDERKRDGRRQSPSPLLQRSENNSTHNDSAIRFPLGMTPMIMPTVNPAASWLGALPARASATTLRNTAIDVGEHPESFPAGRGDRRRGTPASRSLCAQGLKRISTRAAHGFKPRPPARKPNAGGASNASRRSRASRLAVGALDSD